MASSALPLPKKTLKVSELTRYLKYLFEQDDMLGSLSVEGEISSFSKSPSGHIYFTLKDRLSQIPCVLFRREAMQQVATVKELRKGIAVVTHGFLTLYEAQGTCQIYVERVELQGEGVLSRRFEQLKDKLEREGLFAVERKRPLPKFPRKIALVTSPSGQAYHDVLHRLRSQYPFVSVIEVGVSVQGDGAADEMAMAIDIVNRLTDADLILLVRGGGAPEELAAFNEERLARAIFASATPVVTGVGHETDHTIVDLVADQRAATPSLAAAAAVPDLERLMGRIGQLHNQLAHIVRQRLRHERERWVKSNRTLMQVSPQHRLRSQRQRADELSLALERSVAAHFRTKHARLAALHGQLNALDPLAILGRGYSVLLDVETRRVVSRVGQAKPGRLLRARVSDGAFSLRVEEK